MTRPHLALLRGYGLGDEATDLLIALALFKIRQFLSNGLRLRTACDLESKNSLVVTRPSGFVVPEEKTLVETIQSKIAACRHQQLFVVPPITEVTWEPRARASARTKRDEDTEGGETDGEE
jgi:CRISPR-associated protein Csb1